MYQSKLQSSLLDHLFEVILQLETKEECYRFFEDICTIKELQDLGLRLEVAKLLNHGVSYVDIVQKTKASSATIARVNKALLYGADGYRHVLAKKVEKK
jgi:TrpR-related protein YerC/YecD